MISNSLKKPFTSTSTPDQLDTSANPRLSNNVDQVAKPFFFSQAFTNIPDCPVNDGNLFLTTNEKNLDRTLRIMRREPLAGDVMIAVSGFCALNIASVRAQERGQKLPYLLLVDCSTRVEKFWIKMQDIMREVKTPEEVVLKIKKFLLIESEDFWRPSLSNSSQYAKEFSIEQASINLNDLEEEIRSGTSWLSSQEKFETIKQIFKDRLAFIRLNFCDSKSVHALCLKMSELNLKFDSIYLSNIREYAEKDKKLSNFHNSLKKLKSVITNETLLIDTQPRVRKLLYLGDLNQRVVRKILSANIETSFPASEIINISLSNLLSVLSKD